MNVLAFETGAREAAGEFEAVFRAQYVRVARVIARVVRDHARAEDLAVEVFLKFWKQPALPCEMAEAWLYRTAVRKAVDELRSRNRRMRYERVLAWARRPQTPEELTAAAEEQDCIRVVLARMEPRQAELLVLRSEGLSYGELAAALDLNPASIGTFLGRAQEAFRKRYIGIYGKR